MPHIWLTFSHFTGNQILPYRICLLIIEFLIINQSISSADLCFQWASFCLSLHFICICCPTYAYVCCRHILLEALSGQLSIYTWFQAGNCVELPGSLPPQYRSGSTSSIKFPGKFALGHGVKNSTLPEINWAGSSVLNYSKMKQLNFSLIGASKWQWIIYLSFWPHYYIRKYSTLGRFR